MFCAGFGESGIEGRDVSATMESKIAVPAALQVSWRLGAVLVLRG
jgi:hypothetical protein